MRTKTPIKEYYVYTHERDGNVLYVGAGHSNRAYNFTDPRRNKKWYEHVKNGQPITVNIVKTFDSKKDALAFEKELILELKPIANTMGKNKPKYEPKGLRSLTAAEMGRRGAKALHAKFTPEERSERARKAARARWDNREDM